VNEGLGGDFERLNEIMNKTRVWHMRASPSLWQS